MKGDKEKDQGLTEITYQFKGPPEKLHWTKFFYNSNDGTILSRTPASWAKLLLFYLIFYIILAALFAICMQGLFVTLTEEHPKWQLDRSLIGTNPGIGFRPVSDDTSKGSLIWFNSREPKSTQEWTGLLDQFLEPYNNRHTLPGGGANQVNCEFGTPPMAGQVCRIDMSRFGPCSTELGYGYNRSAPCVFIKVNRIFNWEPQYYNDPNDLPAEMPEDLVAYIKNISNPRERDQVWVSCSPAYPRDAEIIGPIEYFPGRGVPGYFYPFTNIPGYLSPLVAIQFARPAVHEIINIECRAWAKNIHYRGGRERTGSVQFELMID